MAANPPYYHEYQVPHTLESRVTIPALQSLLIAAALAIIFLGLGSLAPWPADGWAGLVSLAQRAAGAMVLGLGLAAPVLPILLLRANRSDVRRRYVHLGLEPADVDLDQDGVVEADEVEAVERLFTAAGLVEFVREVVYQRRDWTYRGLVPQYLTRQLYELLIGDILSTMGVLEQQGERQTPTLARNDQGRPLAPAEAEARIMEYLAQHNRTFWSEDIKTEAGPVRVRL